MLASVETHLTLYGANKRYNYINSLVNNQIGSTSHS